MQNLLDDSRKRSKSILEHRCTPVEYFDIMQRFCYLFGEMIQHIDAVCAIENGGSIPARMIADMYNKPCYSIDKKNEINYIFTSNNNYRIDDSVDNDIRKEYKTIALIDDVIDTGKEIERAEKVLQNMGKEYYIFTLFIKPWNKFACMSTHGVHFVEQRNEWIVLPWESHQ